MSGVNRNIMVDLAGAVPLDIKTMQKALSPENIRKEKGTAEEENKGKGQGGGGFTRE